MIEYQDLIARILSRGEDVPDRTGTGTRSIFGHQMRFRLSDGFPLVTVKRTFWRGAFAEMLWMLRGSTNIAWLNDQGVHIWDDWADENGDLGPIYGHQWRSWGERFPYTSGIDQLQELILGIRSDPHSRRHVMSAWNPVEMPLSDRHPTQQAKAGYMALAPCHCLVQFHVSLDGRLSCHLYQRSADVFLGVPFNIAGYALLTHLIAHHLGYEAGDLVWSGGDCHIYSNHLDHSEELLRREPRPLPTLSMDHPGDRVLWAIEPHELQVRDYHPHPAIKAEVSV